MVSFLSNIKLSCPPGSLEAACRGQKSCIVSIKLQAVCGHSTSDDHHGLPAFTCQEMWETIMETLICEQKYQSLHWYWQPEHLTGSRWRPVQQMTGTAMNLKTQHTVQSDQGERGNRDTLVSNCSDSMTELYQQLYHWCAVVCRKQQNLHQLAPMTSNLHQRNLKKGLAGLAPDEPLHSRGYAWSQTKRFSGFE